MLSQDMGAVSCHFREEQALLSALPLVSLEKKLFERSKRNILTGRSRCIFAASSDFSVCGPSKMSLAEESTFRISMMLIQYTVLDISELTGDLLTVGMFVALDYVWDKAKEDRTVEKAIFCVAQMAEPPYPRMILKISSTNSAARRLDAAPMSCHVS